MEDFTKRLLLLLVLFLLVGGVSYAQGTTRGSEVYTLTALSFTPNIQELPGTQAYPFHQFVTLGAIRAYQLLISPSKGSSCPMHPHCSLYGYQAFSRYNPIRAFLMTADRLHRCGHDLGNYETVEVNELVRFLDPVHPSLADNGSNVNIHVWSETPGKVSLGTSRNSNVPGDDLGDDGRLFHFAETLQTDGNYDRAVIEYRRLLSYFPDSQYRKQALSSVFRCYYKAEDYLTAIHWGQALLEKDMDSVDEGEIRFLIGTSYFRLGNYPRARNYFAEVVDINNDDYGDKSLLLLGLSYAKEGDWDSAEDSFAGIGPVSKFSDKAEQSKRLSREGEKLGLRNHTTAGILAIVPGLGYSYDGYKQTALSSFIVNGLFIWATVEAFRRDNQSIGTMLGILSFGWYTGNIYGSVVSAERRNIKLKEDLLLKFDIGFQF